MERIRLVSFYSSWAVFQCTEDQCVDHPGFDHYFSDDDTWEPISNLECPDNIKEYERVKKEKKRDKAEKQIKDEPKAKVRVTRDPQNMS